MNAQTKQSSVEKVEEAAKAAEILAETGKDLVELKDGTNIEIFKCRAKNTSIVFDLARFAMVELGIKNLGEQVEVNLMDPSFILQLIAKASEKVYGVAAELSDIEYQDLMNLELDDAIKLVLKVVEVNKDFFLQSVLPLVQSALPKEPESQDQKSQGQYAKT